MTLSNYPDIEFPFYAQSRGSFIYFFSYLTIGIFLLSNLLLATVVMNYKLLIHKKLKKHEKDVREYFKELFDKLDVAKIGYIPLKILQEALGGDMMVQRDKRLNDLLW